MVFASRFMAPILGECWCVTALVAQAISVGENVRVALGLEQRALVEPHLAIHPDNPAHLLAATIVSLAVGGTLDEVVSQQTCASFLSLDGGRTWRQHDFAITRCFDPWVAITREGDAVFSAVLASGDLVVFHSPDGGRTWDQKPVALGPGHDHATVVVEGSPSGRRSWLYLLSHHQRRSADGKRSFDIFVARSRDGGRAFDEPLKVVPNNLHNLAEMPVVLSDGTVLLSFVDAGRNVRNFTGREGAFDRRRAWVIRSSDGAQTFSIPFFGPTIMQPDACRPCALLRAPAVATAGAGTRRARRSMPPRRPRQRAKVGPAGREAEYATQGGDR